MPALCVDKAGPRFHWLKLRATCHGTEDAEKVKSALRTVAGNAGLDVTETPMESHHGGALFLLESRIEKSRALRDVLQGILDLPGVLEALRATVEARTDDDGVFYVRLDKQDAAQGRLKLTTGEDAVQVRIKLECHPATRDAALGELRRLLDSGRA